MEYAHSFSINKGRQTFFSKFKSPKCFLCTRWLLRLEIHIYIFFLVKATIFIYIFPCQAHIFFWKTLFFTEIFIYCKLFSLPPSYLFIWIDFWRGSYFKEGETIFAPSLYIYGSVQIEYLFTFFEPPPVHFRVYL